MKIFFSLLFLFSMLISLHAQQVIDAGYGKEKICDNLPEEAKIDFDYELDAYYSNVSIFLDLDQNVECEDAPYMSESQVYKTLFFNTFSPNIFLIEAAAHPMSMVGLYVKTHHEDRYNKANYRDFNILESLTAGFDEPYAFSFFLGRMMTFNRENGERIGKNRAYMGYLVTVGDKSIKDNMIYLDNWVNFEIKLKGTRELAHRDLDWSFYVGSKYHQNQFFADTVFLGARRSSTDFNMSSLSFTRNIAYSSKLSFSTDDLSLTEAEFMVEKKWPIGTGKWSANFGIGYLHNSGDKYNGPLREEGIDKHQLLLRPNITF